LLCVFACLLGSLYSTALSSQILFYYNEMLNHSRKLYSYDSLEPHRDCGVWIRLDCGCRVPTQTHAPDYTACG